MSALELSFVSKRFGGLQAPSDISLAVATGEDNYLLMMYSEVVLFVLWFLPFGIGGLLKRLRR